MAREEVVSIVGKVWPYLLVGIALGAAIHGWAPEDWFAARTGGPRGVPIAVGLGVPLYSNAAGVLSFVEDPECRDRCRRTAPRNQEALPE